MRVTAQLGLQTAGRSSTQVRRHDRRCAAKEGEGVRGHALMAEREKRGYPVGLLAHDDVDRIGPRW